MPQLWKSTINQALMYDMRAKLHLSKTPPSVDDREVKNMQVIYLWISFSKTDKYLSNSGNGGKRFLTDRDLMTDCGIFPFSLLYGVILNTTKD